MLNQPTTFWNTSPRSGLASQAALLPQPLLAGVRQSCVKTTFPKWLRTFIPFGSQQLLLLNSDLILESLKVGGELWNRFLCSRGHPLVLSTKVKECTFNELCFIQNLVLQFIAAVLNLGWAPDQQKNKSLALLEGLCITLHLSYHSFKQRSWMIFQLSEYVM